jgi:hypothetical protein
MTMAPDRSRIYDYLSRMPVIIPNTGEMIKLDPSQINKLMELSLNDGSYILDLNRDANLTYQIAGQVREFGFDSVWRSLLPLDGEERTNVDRVGEGGDTNPQISSGKDTSMDVWLNSEGLSDARLQNMAILDIRLSTLEVGEGLYKCPKCSRSETVFYQMQTRSADEPMTTFITCILCNHSWRE